MIVIFNQCFNDCRLSSELQKWSKNNNFISENGFFLPKLTSAAMFIVWSKKNLFFVKNDLLQFAAVSWRLNVKYSRCFFSIFLSSFLCSVLFFLSLVLSIFLSFLIFHLNYISFFSFPLLFSFLSLKLSFFHGFLSFL